MTTTATTGAAESYSPKSMTSLTITDVASMRPLSVACMVAVRSSAMAAVSMIAMNAWR